jgi:hypothetical protein
LENAKNAASTHSICELAEKLSGDTPVDETGAEKKDKKSWLKFLGK